MKSLKQEAIRYLFYVVVSIFLFWNAPSVIYSVPIVGFGMATVSLILVLYVVVSIVIRILYSIMVAIAIGEEYPGVEFGWLEYMRIPIMSRSQLKKRIQLHKEDPVSFPSLLDALELEREV